MTDYERSRRRADGADRDPLRRWAVASQGALALTSMVALFTSTFSRIDFTVSVVQLGLALLIVAYFGAALISLRYIARVRTLDLRVALTGQPGAGKTVLANLLFDALMEANTSYGFTADQRSAIEVHQMIRGIQAGHWPASTRSGSVMQYRGLAQFGRRLRVDLELGDSAGEHWIDLVNNAPGSADYLEYAISADALIHVVSAPELALDPSVIQADLDELRVTAQLMRATRGRNGQLGPLLIVLSKFDRLDQATMQIEELLRITTIPELVALSSSKSLPTESLSDLNSLAERLEAEFASVNVMLSSHVLTLGRQRLQRASTSELPLWLRDAAIIHAGERSIVLRSIRRFRGLRDPNYGS